MEVYELDHSKSPKIGPAKKIPFFLKKDLLFLKRCHIIVKAIRSKGVFQKRVNCEQLHNAELCNGSTADSDSVCEGSNPSSAATENRLFFEKTVFLLPFRGFPVTAI